jgi:hypothetical protein
MNSGSEGEYRITRSRAAASRHTRQCRQQAIAKAEAVTGNAPRLVRAATPCLCKELREEGPGGADAPRPFRSLPWRSSWRLFSPAKRARRPGFCAEEGACRSRRGCAATKARSCAAFVRQRQPRVPPQRQRPNAQQPPSASAGASERRRSVDASLHPRVGRAAASLGCRAFARDGAKGARRGELTGVVDIGEPQAGQ